MKKVKTVHVCPYCGHEDKRKDTGVPFKVCSKCKQTHLINKDTLRESDTIAELPLKVLIPWTLAIFFLVIASCWLACDMLNKGKDPVPKTYYEETE